MTDTPERIVSVLVPVPSPGGYSYIVPEGMIVHPGSIVQVPLGPRQVSGIVWGEVTEVIPVKKLRPVTQVFDCPPIAEDMRRFVDWVASYTVSPPGMVARMLLRVPAAFEPEPPSEGLKLTGTVPTRLTAARKRVLAQAEEGPGWTRAGLARAAGVSLSVIDGLKEAGAFETEMIAPAPLVPAPDPGFGRFVLSDGQQAAAEQLIELIQLDGFQAALLEGVTGSGKTEVYFEAIAAVVEAGKQVLVLVPEIALTQSFLQRFHDRFGAFPGEWHSDVPPKRREKTWRQVAEGRVQVVAGARSALYLPFKELGLIVVDEEHDPAFKQEDRVSYSARDMAVVRASLSGFPVVLASATPSVESRVNAENRRYNHVRLGARYGKAVLPDLNAVDMRKHPPAAGKFISPVLARAVTRALEDGGQALLFLNRRGYAPLTLCRVCGHRFQCPNCSSWLVEHRFRSQIMCHHCGYHESTPEACPECGTLDHLVPCGPGVERIAEEVVADFPDARVLVLSSDIGGVRRLRLEFEAVANGEVDIVVGTQLVAKGHNFPNMNLVGVLDADIGLTNGDPRASERTFQLLSQVTGRAGRMGQKSRGLIQTYQPEHPVIEAIVAGDREGFYAREVEMRRLAQLPPFGRLAALIVSAADKSAAHAHAVALKQVAPHMDGVELLGPAEAPLALVRGRYRFRLLLMGARQSNLQDFIRHMIANGPKERGSVRVQIDVDPQSFV